VETSRSLDYSPGRVRFEQAAYLVNENGNSDEIILRREGGISNTGTVTIDSFSVDAVAGSDYAELSGVQVTFAPGQSFIPFHLAYFEDVAALSDAPVLTESGEPILNIVNDREAEEDQTIKLYFSAFEGVQTGTQTEAEITLVSDDTAIRYAEASGVFGESSADGQAVVTVLRNGPVDRPVSVDYYTSDGTALSAGLQPDYVETYGTLIFKVGESSRDIAIPILDDTHQEGVETLKLHLLNAKPAGSAYVEGPTAVELVIQDGDRDSLRSSVSFIREGDVTGQATVGFATIDQTASGGIDYDSVIGEVVFAEGSSEQTIVVPILDDNIAEGDETFALRLFDPEGARLGSLDEITVKIPGDEAGTLVFATWNDETDWVNDSGSDKMVWEGDQITDPDNLLDIDWNKRDYVFAVAENESALPYDADTSNSFRVPTCCQRCRTRCIALAAPIWALL